jgi:hypothetical protein
VSYQLPSSVAPKRPLDLREGDYSRSTNICHVYKLNPDGTKGEYLRTEMHRPSPVVFQQPLPNRAVAAGKRGWEMNPLNPKNRRTAAD